MALTKAEKPAEENRFGNQQPVRAKENSPPIHRRVRTKTAKVPAGTKEFS
jgi:hypothetical protein